MSEEMKDSDMRVYELGYLIVPSVSEEDLPKKVGELRDVIEKAGGVFIADEHAKKIALAYEMIKNIANVNVRFNEAYFGWMKFECDPSKVRGIEETVARDTDVIRSLLFKTVRESTLAQKRILKDGPRKRTYQKRDENAPEINKEEVDKKIDELVDA